MVKYTRELCDVCLRSEKKISKKEQEAEVQALKPERAKKRKISRGRQEGGKSGSKTKNKIEYFSSEEGKLN